MMLGWSLSSSLFLEASYLAEVRLLSKLMLTSD